MESRVETITPELATQYLSHNVKNRSIRKDVVDAYAREIKRGSFVVTHQGIAFDGNGNLVDGQHRLMAIAMSGKPVKMMVTRGMEPESLAVIDRGTSRTMRDVITLGNYGDDDLALVMRDTVMQSAMSQLVVWGYKKMKLTTAEYMDLFTAFGDVAIVAYRAARKRGSIGRSQIISAAIAAMLCGVDQEAVNKFFGVFHKSNIQNCEGYNIRAALNWRRQIDDAKIAGMPMNSKKIYLGTQLAIWHFVNNTDVSRVVVANRPKYDVADKLKNVIGD